MTANTITERDFTREKLWQECQRAVIAQIIGPFGLSPLMFEDKEGGNVTTQLNAEKGIFAKKEQEYNRTDYNYQKAKKEKMKDAVQSGKMNSSEFTDSYTGKKEPSRRDENGKQKANFEADHVVPLKEIHKRNGWRKTKEGRKKVASEKDNLQFTTTKNNRSKGAKSAEDALSKDHGYDENITRPIVENAKKSIEKHDSTLKENLIYDGKELLKTGSIQAGKMAIRAALGLLLTEVVSSLFTEIKNLVQAGIEEGKTLYQEVKERLKKIVNQIIKKTPELLKTLFEGGISGFISNLLTFLINKLITTVGSVVTIIREGFTSLVKAIRLIFFPPENMSRNSSIKEACTLISATVITSIGIFVTSSIATFISTTFPMIAGFSDVITNVLVGSITGIITALIAYKLEDMFNPYSHDETIMEQTLKNANTLDKIQDKLVESLDGSFKTIKNYALSIGIYQDIGENLFSISHQYSNALNYASFSISGLDAMNNLSAKTIDNCEKIIKSMSNRFDKCTNHISEINTGVECINNNYDLIEDFLKDRD